MKPLVSILIPAYNAERWVAEAIESALRQTWSRKQVIVIDDGSVDQTLAIAQTYSSENVNVVSQENKGAAAARNRGFALSQGDYIQWLDADDILAPDKISVQIKVLDGCINRRTLVSGAWGSFFFRTSNARFDPTPLWCDLSPADWFVTKWNHNTHMQTATWLISRELTEMAGPWDERLLSNDDGEYLCRVIKSCELIKFVRKAKVFYRVTGPTRLSYIGGSNEKLDAQWLGMKLQIAHVRALEDSPRTRAACLRFLSNWILHFYPERVELLREMEELAMSLGSRLEVPRLSWKYAWIRSLFGWSTTKRLRMWYNRSKWNMIISWHSISARVGRKLAGARLRVTGRISMLYVFPH